MKETYTITLRALPDRTPAIQRLKAFLKRAKRDWLLVCERCVEATPENFDNQKPKGRKDCKSL